MNKLFRTTIALMTAAFGVACSSSTSGSGSSNPTDEVADICAKFVSCGTEDGTTGTPYTQSSCESDYDGWVPPAGCQSAIDAATCGDINGGGGSALSTCFPTCTGVGGTQCDGDNLAECVGAADGGATTGETITVTCSSACANHGETYTGVCGASYQGMTSSNGEDTCWCK